MIKANYTDKLLIVDLLSKSFDKNKSINFIAKQDAKRIARIRLLMEYSFEICYMFGAIYLSEDKKACALVLYPERKKTNLKTIYWDAKFALQCIGITRIHKIRQRERLIKSHHPATPILYLWFIAVDPEYQKTGIGAALIRSIIQESKKSKKDIYLETSTLANIPWYEKFGFKIVKEVDVGYPLFIFKRRFVD